MKGTSTYNWRELLLCQFLKACTHVIGKPPIVEIIMYFKKLAPRGVTGLNTPIQQIQCFNAGREY